MRPTTQETVSREALGVQPMRPLRTAHELKEATLRDYRRNMERIGVTADAGALERLVVNDLQLVDYHNAGVDKTRTAPKPKPEPKPGPPPEALNRDGLVVYDLKGKAVKRRRSMLSLPSRLVDDKWPYAMGRILRITEGAYAKKSVAECVATSECPELAREVFTLYLHYINPNPSVKNFFYGLKQADVDRKVKRMVEDICDKSAGKLGQWYFDAGRGRR